MFLSPTEQEDVGQWACVGWGAETPNSSKDSLFRGGSRGGRVPLNYTSWGAWHFIWTAHSCHERHAPWGPCPSFSSWSFWAGPLPIIPRAELQSVEVLFLPYFAKKLAEVSADLWGEVDGHDAGPSGEIGVKKGKLLHNLKAKIDAYWVGHQVLSSLTRASMRPSGHANSREKTPSLFRWQSSRY